MAEKKKIIVIEDDRDFRESMVEYLELAGLNVTGVSCALEFYQALARGERFLLAIVDIGLPDQDGHVLAGYIRKNTEMRIVMLTAQSSLDSKVTAYRSGADLYLVKPIDFAELAASLSSILSRLDAASPTTPATMQAEANPWVLHRHDATLSTPVGDRISLTSKEFDLLEQLALKPGALLERTELLHSLAYGNDDLGNRALDALVHRLRRKKEELDQRIPVKTLHGAGYSFSAPLVIK
ncbi:MAG: response regulator transcription factor [Chlorobiaceae bacterium]|nr:response regulator transcription factor [Chlorobiaceae bacterium]